MGRSGNRDEDCGIGIGEKPCFAFVAGSEKAIRKIRVRLVD